MSDQEKRKVLKNYLLQAQIIESQAEKYVDKLFESNIGSLDRLRRKVERSPNFLTELGFDEFDVEDIQCLLNPLKVVFALITTSDKNIIYF